MKPLIICFIIALFFSSCDSNKKKITQTEFERLFTHDSIESVQTNKNKPEVVITVKSVNKNSNIYILPIKSTESFENSFHKLREKLISQNIHFSNYSSCEVMGDTYFLFILTLIYPFFILSTLILFLITAIDVLKNKFESSIDKLIWVFVLLLPVIGPLLYIYIGRKQKLAKT
jgi:ATP-dependent Zn protease